MSHQSQRWLRAPVSSPMQRQRRGVISFTKSACDPLAPHNIRINSLAPGAINTDMIYEISPEMLEHAALNHAVKTFGHA